MPPYVFTIINDYKFLLQITITNIKRVRFCFEYPAGFTPHIEVYYEDL